MKVSLFRKINKVNEVEFISIGEALKRIRDGESQIPITQIRANLMDKELVSKIKKSLPAIVWAGEARNPVQVTKGDRTYESYRTDESVSEHSGLFVLDLDDISDHEKVMEMLDDNPYVCAHWQSPSGYPKRKALVRCKPDVHAHADMYQAFIDEYPSLKLDTTSRNIGRLCFESYDPEIVIKVWRDVKVWDKLPVVEDVKKPDKKKKTKTYKSDSKIAIAVWMIRGARDGHKHEALIKAAYLMGGYIAKGIVKEEDAVETLRYEISQKNVADLELAYQTISDGIKAGKSMPIHEIRQIENSQTFYEKDDGEYSFLANMEDIGKELEARRTGNIRRGRTTGIKPLDEYFVHKESTFVVMLGFDNVGKSTAAWYLMVLDALSNGTRWLIYSSENNDADIVEDMACFYIGKKIEAISEAQYKDAMKWFNRHFKVLSGERGIYSHEEMLSFMSAEYDKSGPYDAVLIEPWNGMIRKGDSLKMNSYEYSIWALSQYNLFKKQYCSVYVCMHAVTDAARINRSKPNDSEQKRYRPAKFDGDGGQIIPNRCDDFLVIDRDTADPVLFMETNIYVDKVKRVKTGGKVTFKDQPVVLRYMRAGQQQHFGFHDKLAVDNVERLKEPKQESINYTEILDEAYEGKDDLPF